MIEETNNAVLIKGKPPQKESKDDTELFRLASAFFEQHWQYLYDQVPTDGRRVIIKPKLSVIETSVGSVNIEVYKEDGGGKGLRLFNYLRIL